MKILVAIKRVVDANVKVRVKSDGTGVDLTNAKMAINPFCEIAIEEAIRIKESGAADEVIAVSVGPQVSQEQIRTALALGAEPVRGRDLVRRLRGAGLRLAAPQRPGAWEEVGRWTDVGFRPDVASTLIPVLATALEAVDADWATARTVALFKEKNSNY